VLVTRYFYFVTAHHCTAQVKWTKYEPKMNQSAAQS